MHVRDRVERHKLDQYFTRTDVVDLILGFTARVSVGGDAGRLEERRSRLGLLQPLDVLVEHLY